MATVFLNGDFVARDDARLSAFDAGLQHGVGLFETMLAAKREDGWTVVHGREHVDRLVQSARLLGLSESLRLSALEEAIARTVTKAGEEMAGATRLRVRLTITGGDLNLLEQGRAGGAEAGTSGGGGEGGGPQESQRAEGRGGRPGEPTVLIVASPATQYPKEMFERGIGVVVAGLRVNPLEVDAGHKTLHYWPRLRELQVAAGNRAGEALVFQITNHLAGGCVSNAFIVKDDVLITPIARGEEEEVARLGEEDDGERMGQVGGKGAAMPSPVLPGVTRRWVMDWARSQRLDVERRLIRIDDVLGADEVFLTNSSWGVLPVVRVEKEAIGDGVVGAVSKDLVEAWRGAVDG